ncbi:MAG: hypothetical protein ACRDVW_12325 [Acidimicrobiales bacterium]
MPVIERLSQVASGMMTAGETGVRAGLFGLVAALSGQVERAGVRGGSLARLTGGEVCLAEAVERLSFAEPVPALAGHRPSLLEVVDGQLALPQLGGAEVSQRPRLASPVFGLAEQVQGPGEMILGGPAAAQAQVEVTDKGQHVGFVDPVAGLLAKAVRPMEMLTGALVAAHPQVHIAEAVQGAGRAGLVAGGQWLVQRPATLWPRRHRPAARRL